MTISTATGGNADITFYDNYIPPLRAQQFTLTFSQSLTAASGSPAVPSSPQADITQTFIVRGPRFVIQPSDISRQFPPANATGDYGDYLPSILLRQPELPWEQALNINDGNAYPWVALLVFTADELNVPTPASGSAPTIPAGSQQNPTCTAAFPLTQVIQGQSPGLPSGIYGPDLSLNEDEDPTAITVNVIDVPVGVFQDLLPSLQDLPFLAHAREVAQNGTTATSTNAPTRWFSALVANRLPINPAPGSTAGQKNIVHLVSLEGLEALLGADSATVPSGYTAVRMISLASWTFSQLPSSTPPFSSLALNLVSPASTQGTNLLLRLPLPAGSPLNPAQQTVVDRFTAGYVPLSYQLRTGEQTFAWYRGPLAPVQVPGFLQSTGPGTTDNPLRPFNASQAMIYDPTSGVFDQSYAVAFQTGRSLALASKTFASNLLQWRRQAHTLVDTLLSLMQVPSTAASLLADGIIDSNGNLTGTGIADLSELLNGDVITDTLADFIASDVFDSIASTVGVKGGFARQDRKQTLTNAPAQTPPNVPSDLTTLMQDPTVVSLLQYLSGLLPLGTLAADLTGTVASVTLNSPGLAESLKKGTTFSVTSSDGATVAIFQVSAHAAKGDTTVSVNSVTLPTAISSGAALQLGSGGILPVQIIDWLAKVALLDGVPFNNLVPNATLLPAESIRFFYVDPNWIDSLIDGALSSAVQSSRDSLFHQLMRDSLHRAVDAAILQVRQSLLGLSAGAALPGNDPISGFLLRSALVSGWTGMKIQAWATDDNSQPPLPALRFETLSSNTLLVLYASVPQRIEISEPTEGLVFGLEDTGVSVRYLPGVTGATTSNLGQVIDASKSLGSLPRRNSSDPNSAINVAGTDGLVDQLQSQFPSPQPTLTPASFAVTMVRVPEQMVFEPLTA